MDRLGKLLNNEKLTFETKHRRKNGSIIDVEVHIKKVKVGSKNLLVSVERDITERKKSEDVLKQERGMLESVTKNIGAGLVMISKDYKILWMNNFLRQFTGASENNHCYSSFNTCTSICPDCGPKKIFEGAAFDSREYCNQTEYNKDHPVWFELIATPIKDKEGNVVAALELTLNITEKKEAETKFKENSDKIDLMNEKLRVVGSLTRHDVGNKIMAAKSNLYLLKKRVGDNPDLIKYLDNIGSAFASSDEIFEFSRLYEKIGAEKPSKENVFESFNQAVVLMPNLGNIEVVNECQGLQVIADSLLKQLFYNFIDNSLKHGEKVTQISLRYIKNADGLKLLYEDNGVGIPEANKPKLFEAGFSTGKGSGLGLYLIKKMMDVYGWTITEKGESGKGAKFVISIP
jgi:PAS domain-containing protein